jgi:outer membrane receptor protein involved in Fe transport
LRFAWGDYYQAQAIQDLAIPDGDTSYYEPQQAEHRVIGLRYRLGSHLDLQADIYQKRYKSLRPRYENLLDIYEFAPESNFDRTRVEPQKGEARGVELTLRSRAAGPVDWWLNYTWSKVDDTISGVEVPRSWDQRNALTANLAWHGGRWSVSVVARYHSGWPRTPLLVEPVIDDNDNIVGVIPDLTQRNSATFDNYSRVDFRVSRHVPLSRGSFEYYFELFNVFDSKNECCTSDHTLSIGSGISVAPEIDDYLPLFPSFGFVWRFGPGAEAS